MSSEKAIRQCPDCAYTLQRIQILDLMGQHGTETGLTYMATEEEPQVGLFNARVANKTGAVHGHLCPGCSRVLFYAEI